MVKRHLTVYSFVALACYFTSWYIPALARPNPFYPSSTMISSQNVALSFPFDSYEALGYVRGPDKSFVIMQNQEKEIFYLSKGQALGLEKFWLSSIKVKKTHILVSFSKKVHDLAGEEEFLYRQKKIRKE